MASDTRPRGRGSAWTETATLTLIGFYDEHKQMFENADKQAEKILWMKAARKVTLTGFNVNGRQAQLKFNTLLTRYQNTIDTEGSSTACPYYDVLHDVIGYGEQEVDTVNVEVAGSGAEVTEVTEMMDQDGVEVDSEGDESPEGPLEDSHRGSQELPGDEDGEEEAVVFDEELLQLIESNREVLQLKSEDYSASDIEDEEVLSLLNNKVTLNFNNDNVWNDKLYRDLIAQYGKHKVLLRGKRTERMVGWKLISQALLNHGYKLLPVELESRWLMLVKTFRECVDYNLTNNTEDKCEYYDEISDVYDYSSNGIKVERQEEEEVIGGSSTHKKFDPICWGDQSTLLLISLWDQFQPAFNHPKVTKKYIWERIAQQLSDAGFETSAIQAETKWKNLTRMYRATLDNLDSKPNVDRYCSYFDELSEVYDYKPHITIKKPNVQSRHRIENQLEELANHTEPSGIKRKLSDTENCTRSYKAKRLTVLQEKVESTELLQAVQKMHDELKEIEMEKIRIARKMHEEKLVLFNKLLEVLQK